MASPAARPAECNWRGILLDRCTSRYLDGTCRRCGKRKGK